MTSIGDANCGSSSGSAASAPPYVRRPVEAQEQISGGIATPMRDPALSTMIRRVVDRMAGLAEALKVAQPVISGIVVQVRGGQHNACGAPRNQRQQVRPARPPAARIAPGLLDGIEPTPIGHATDQMSIRPSAFLTLAAGTLKPYR
jgi:hypothetical protein